MGRTQETITVSISVSNHNDEQDEIDLVLRGIAWIV